MALRNIGVPFLKVLSENIRPQLITAKLVTFRTYEAEF